jgi:signal transduction histidine kinase
VKYSGVRHLDVRSWGTPNEVHLTVSDFGSGFDIEAAKAGRGLGLVSMDERLKILNGTLSIESQLKRGQRSMLSYLSVRAAILASNVGWAIW